MNLSLTSIHSGDMRSNNIPRNDDNNSRLIELFEKWHKIQLHEAAGQQGPSASSEQPHCERRDLTERAAHNKFRRQTY